MIWLAILMVVVFNAIGVVAALDAIVRAASGRGPR